MVLEAVQGFLFHEFLSMETLTTTEYEKAEMGKTPQEREQLLATRLSGYQQHCLFGLGSMFMGSATDVLAHLDGKLSTTWIDYFNVYLAVALVLMLIGLAGATSPSGAPLPLWIAGLGAWQAFIFVIVTFHVASLKYHSNIKEFQYSLYTSISIVTFYWGYSAQDPKMLHILSKLIVWIIGIVLYGIGFILYYLIWKGVCWLGRKIGSAGSSIKEKLLVWYHATSGYQPLTPPAVT